MSARTNGANFSSSSLSRLLSPENLRRLAGAGAYERGARYFHDGMVEVLTEGRGNIEADVSGTHVYRVRLWAGGSTLDHLCDCPVGEAEKFCKHCVATALAWAEHRQADQIVARSELDTIEIMLRAMPKETLVSLIMEQAAQDDGLRRELVLESARGSREKLQVSDYRALIDKTTHVGGPLDRRQVRAFTAGVMEVAGTIMRLPATGEEEGQILELMEHLLRRTDQALPGAYDADGTLDKLRTMHYELCERFSPDPLELADRLFRLELEGGSRTFHDTFGTYALLLGEAGRERFRQHARGAWERAPIPVSFAAPGNGMWIRQTPGPEYSAILSIMETIADYTGDVEDAAIILAKELSTPYHYMRLVQLYGAAKRRAEAIAWAEKGVKALPPGMGVRLTEFLMEEYARGREFEAAAEHAWRWFTESPSLATYTRLKSYGVKAGSWLTWRARAIAALATPPEREDAEAPSGDSSLLVEILLAEKDDEAAWEQALAGGCSDALWLALAARRAKSHPEDAVAVYEAQIEALGATVNQQNYETIIGHLKKMGPLMEALGRDEEFREYLDEMRTTWKRRAKFIALLDAAFPSRRAAARSGTSRDDAAEPSSRGRRGGRV